MSHTSSPAPGTHLRVDGVSVSFADRRVLTDVSFSVTSGSPVGLIGENGSGKSTLLRVIAGLTVPDAGSVSAAAPGGGPAHVGLLQQEPLSEPKTTPSPTRSCTARHARTVSASLEEAVARSRRAADGVSAAAARLAAVPDSPDAAAAYACALDSAERLGAWDVDARVEAMLGGFGLAGLPRDRPVGELSGGHSARLSLACLLLSSPDVLLLDEPTNHLDDAAADHLRSVVTDWPGPVLATSHDRAFLDDVATSLVDLDPSPMPHAHSRSLLQGGIGTGLGAALFTGSYSEYAASRQDARSRWEQQYREEQAELRRLRAQVTTSQHVGHRSWTPRSEVRMAQKYYADRNATAVSRRVTDARRRLEELTENQVRRPPRLLRFAGLTAAGAPGTRGDGGPGKTAGTLAGALTATSVAVRDRLTPTTMTVEPGSAWLITGPNGSGKSTLLHVLAGLLEPTSGAMSKPGGMRVGLLAQDVTLPTRDRDARELTCRQAYAELVGPETAERVPLSRFGLLEGRDENRPVSALSGGQRRRLALAAVLADPPDVLLLDEPTNHLSLPVVTDLEAALPEYPGAVVVASHDRWLRRRWHGDSLSLPAGPE